MTGSCAEGLLRRPHVSRSSAQRGSSLQILCIEHGVRVVQLMPLGYPADLSPVPRTRLALEEIVHRERW